MKRRNFILIAIAGLAGTVTRWTGRSDDRYASALDYMPLIEGLAEIFRDTEAAVAVGEAYLGNHSGDKLLRHLLSGVGIDEQGMAALRPSDFHARRHKDFLQGKVLLFDGWLMARSELCACALLAYSRKERRIL